MRVLFDTNVLLRMASGGNRSRFFQLWLAQHFDLVMSLATLTEFRTVSNYPKIQKFMPTSVSAAFTRLLETRAAFVQPDLTAPTCRDPKDTALIATAVGGGVDFLVTSDKDLLDDLSLKEALLLHGIRVLPPHEFLN